MKKFSLKNRFIVLITISILVFLSSLFIGRYSIDFSSIINILTKNLINIFSFGHYNVDSILNSTQQTIFLNIRFPRICVAGLIGIALSTAGVSYQGMFRNPMVAPDLLGASSGAGFGAAFSIIIGLNYFLTTSLSFIFGLIAVFFAYIIGKAGKLNINLSVILSGIMISSIFTSLISLVKLLADTNNQLPAITYWLMGSLSSVKNSDMIFLFVIVSISFIPIYLLRWRINLLTLSDIEARSLGVNTKRLRLIVIVCATIMTSGSVAVSGIIGWVGLIVPHFCRIIFGYNYRHLIPASALLGAAFLIFVDTVSRTVSTSEIPLGILTSFVGAPIFIYLILTGGSKYDS